MITYIYIYIRWIAPYICFSETIHVLVFLACDALRPLFCDLWREVPGSMYFLCFVDTKFHEII